MLRGRWNYCLRKFHLNFRDQLIQIFRSRDECWHVYVKRSHHLTKYRFRQSVQSMFQGNLEEIALHDWGRDELSTSQIQDLVEKLKNARHPLIALKHRNYLLSEDRGLWSK